MAKCLQKDDDEGHQRLDQAELQSGLLAEAQEANRVGLALQTAGAIQARCLDGLAANLRHNIALATQVLIAQRQEVVDDKGWMEMGLAISRWAKIIQNQISRTFVAVAHRKEVDVNVIRVEEKQTDPGVGGIDGHNEQNAHDPALLLWIRVPAQVLVDLPKISISTQLRPMTL